MIVDVGISAHALLSAVHSDTVANSVVKGDLLIGDGTPKWARFPAPGDGIYGLSWTSGVPTWSAVGSGTIGGTIADTQIAFGTAADTIGSSPNLTYLPSRVFGGPTLTVGTAGGVDEAGIMIEGGIGGFAEPSLMINIGAHEAAMQISALGPGYFDDDLVDIASSGIIWSQQAGGLAIVANGDIHFGAGGSSFSVEMFRVSQEGDLVVHPTGLGVAGQQVGFAKADANTIEITNTQLAGDRAYRDLKLRSLNSTATVTSTDFAGGTWQSKTLTLANSLITSGNFSLTLTTTNTTNVTLPTTGTLATLAGSESLTNKKLGTLTSNGFVKTSGGDGTLSVDTNTYLTSVTAHNLLSSTHGDTTTGSVARGDLITGQGASPTWTRLAKGTANQVLAMDGTATDIVWATQSTGAPTDATYITQTANGSLSAEQALSSLSSGIMRVATTTGVITSLGDILPTANGGTGIAFFTAAGPTAARVYTFPDAAATIARTDAAQTFTGSQTIAALVGPVTITEAVGSSGLTITGATQTSNFPALNITQTWNALQTFTLIKGNATSTSSNAASLLMDLQVGASPKFSVDKAGRIGIGTNSPGYEIQIGSSTFFGIATNVGSGRPGLIVNANAGIDVNVNGGQQYNFNNIGFSIGATDVILARDAANTLGLRNSTNAQKFKVYNTFTTVDTVGEWFAIDWITTANVVNLQAVKGSSTGTARVLTVSYGGAQASPVAAITVPITSGPIVFGGGITTAGPVVYAANYMELTEMTAPAAGATNNVRVYAEDSGGKTRLMALFPTGAAVQLAIEP